MRLMRISRGPKGYTDLPTNWRFGLKRRSVRRTALTCSIGIAPNKYLAKIASDFKKPDGLTIIAEEQVREFLQKLPVGKIPGVGKKTGEELKTLGIVFVSDILNFPATFMDQEIRQMGSRPL